MNILKISKTTLLAAAIIGSPALLADSAVSRSETSTSYEQSQSTTQVERETSPTNSSAGADGHGINSTTEGDVYSASREQNADQQEQALGAQAGRHIQMLEFEADSVMLNDNSQEKLDTLAGSLDKDTPAKVTVQVETQGSRFDRTDSAAVSTNNEAGTADTLASDANSAAGSDGALDPTREDAAVAQLNQEMQENERLISEHRAERVKQFLEDRGIEVTEVTVESGDQQGVASDTGATQEDMGAEQASDENVQEVLIVISERGGERGVSAR